MNMQLPITYPASSWIRAGIWRVRVLHAAKRTTWGRGSFFAACDDSLLSVTVQTPTFVLFAVGGKPTRRMVHALNRYGMDVCYVSPRADVFTLIRRLVPE